MLIYICCQVTQLSVDETEQAIRTWGVIYQWIKYFMAAILAAIFYFSNIPASFNSNVPSNRFNIKKLTMYNNNKRAQRALGRLPEEKVKGHRGAIYRGPLMLSTKY